VPPFGTAGPVLELANAGYRVSTAGLTLVVSCCLDGVVAGIGGNAGRAVGMKS
jgi:hypothetical protein